jgi:hypothetical protein
MRTLARFGAVPQPGKKLSRWTIRLTSLCRSGRSSVERKKAKIKGSREELNMQSGANQVRIIKDGLRSNVATLNL